MMLTLPAPPTPTPGANPSIRACAAVAFVHGAQNDHSVWILQSRYFAHHGFAVLAWDLPGHGRSAGPALDTVEAMADWVLRASLAAGPSAWRSSVTAWGR
jgi:pimeloyl-ACP methyl ester carboxylesterase